MLGFVSGKVVSIYEGTAVVENNGLGFELAVSSNTLDSLKTGADVKLFTYLHVYPPLTLAIFYPPIHYPCNLDLIRFISEGCTKVAFAKCFFCL